MHLLIDYTCIYIYIQSPWKKLVIRNRGVYVTGAVKLYHSYRLLATALISGLWLGWGLP